MQFLKKEYMIQNGFKSCVLYFKQLHLKRYKVLRYKMFFPWQLEFYYYKQCITTLLHVFYSECHISVSLEKFCCTSNYHLWVWLIIKIRIEILQLIATIWRCATPSVVMCNQTFNSHILTAVTLDFFLEMPLVCWDKSHLQFNFSAKILLVLET